MSSDLSVVGESGDTSLAGLPEADSGLVIALGAATARESRPAVRWLDGMPSGEDGPAQRTIAPAGDGLWRVAPWPAADALFELDVAASDRSLVVGAGGAAAAAVAERAAARGVAVELVERLDAGGLAEAACVILPEAPGGALPARAFAVLAARRLLIVPRIETSFGLEDGLDHVEYADLDEAMTLVEAYRRAPEAFARITTWGRAKAEGQRASVVYGRLAQDLLLYGA